jgi:hypothetical protein
MAHPVLASTTAIQSTKNLAKSVFQSRHKAQFLQHLVSVIKNDGAFLIANNTKIAHF